MVHFDSGQVLGANLIPAWFPSWDGSDLNPESHNNRPGFFGEHWRINPTSLALFNDPVCASPPYLDGPVSISGVMPKSASRLEILRPSGGNRRLLSRT